MWLKLIQRHLEKRFINFLKSVVICIALLFAGCSGQSQRSQYLLAERLWSDGNYAAAVAAFEKAATRDPRSKMGLQSLYRAANTQLLYLSQPAEALQKLSRYAELTDDAEASWEAKLQMGDIYYSKLEQPENVIRHYQALLKARPNSPDAPEIRFRIARSYFLLSRFKEAIEGYEMILKLFPNSREAERAEYEIAMTYYTQAESGASNYQRAIQKFKEFISRHGDSKLVVEAKFGIASSWVELDQLDDAEELFTSLQKTYPSPNVIQIKLARLRERKAQKRR